MSPRAARSRDLAAPVEVAPSVRAGVAAGAVDPRIASALAWCAEQRIRRLLLAAPFALDAPTLTFVRAHAEVQGVVWWPGQLPPPASANAGVFLPELYSWRLPARCPPHILFIDGPGALTARMITAALRRRVRSVVYTAFGTWCRRALPLLAATKLAGKVAARCVQSGRGPCQLVVDRWYERSLAPLLAHEPLQFDLGGGARSRREGVVIACPTLVAGGAERQIVNTALGLRAAGVTPLTVLVSRLHSPPGNAFFLDRLLAAGVQVREVASPSSSLERWSKVQALAADAAGRRTLTLLRRLPLALAQDILDLGLELARLRPAVVHAWLDYSNTRAGLAAACAGVPKVILSGRNVSPRHFAYIHEPFMRGAYRALLRQPGMVLSNNSRGGAADYAAWLGIDAAGIEIVYNGVDLGALQRPGDAERAAFRARYGIGADAPVIGGLFRWSAEKRPLLWLEVAALLAQRLPAARFLLFGEGPLREAMRRQIDVHALADRVLLLPPTMEVALALGAFDLLLLTSEWEGTPNVAIEAQAVGTPVVLTGGGGAREAIAEGTSGLYVEAPAAQALAEAIVEVLTAHPGLPASRAMAFVQDRFAMARMLARTRSLYRL